MPPLLIAEALDVATEFGARPFAPWVTVTPNTFGGVDVGNAHNAETYRLADDDGRLTLHRFTGGPALILAGTLTFTGTFANSFTIGTALRELL